MYNKVLIYLNSAFQKQDQLFNTQDQTEAIYMYYWRVHMPPLSYVYWLYVMQWCIACQSSDCDFQFFDACNEAEMYWDEDEYIRVGINVLVWLNAILAMLCLESVIVLGMNVTLIYDFLSL